MHAALAMMNDRDIPERPRLEPEIIPPGRPDWRLHRARPQAATFSAEAHRIYVGRFGPFGFALFMLILGAVIAVIALAVVGALLIWIPVAAVLLIVAALFGLNRRRRA